MKKKQLLWLLPAAFACHPIFAETPRSETLQEVIVTAERQARSLQDTPIAISVLNSEQMEASGITGLSSLQDGLIPALKVMPFANSPSTLVMTIRGNGPTDLGPITRDGSVATYLDGVYLGRAEGLSFEVADMERIEVLRGPQGTLFGRNANGGAVNLISKRPSGDFNLQQTVGFGSYGERRGVTHIDLPSWRDIKVKLDYVHSQRDGWVRNQNHHESNYDEYKKDGGRIAIDWSPQDALSVSYVYDNSRIASTQLYFQMWKDSIGLIGAEPDREKKTRLGVAPLDPSTTRQSGHALTINWDLADHTTLRSISSYRDLREHTLDNFAGALYNNGYIANVEVEQSQSSEELQLIGDIDRLNYILGLYLYKEDAYEAFQNQYSLDEFGVVTGVPLTPIPVTTRNPRTGEYEPLRRVSADANSKAIYGQFQWTPPLLDERLKIIGGIRYTRDSKFGVRHLPESDTTFDLDTNHIDTSATLDYRFADHISAYVKRTTGYQAGGVNPRSQSFAPYKENTVVSWEVGLKSELFNRRLRTNADLFRADYDGIPIDYSTADISVTETINAKHNVRVEGGELDITALPLDGLSITASYVYLNSHMPLQPNPLQNNLLQKFAVTQTPRHSGSVSIDYNFNPLPIGVISLHMDITSTTGYSYVQTDLERNDAYTLLNARLTLSDIDIGKAGTLKLSAYGKNLTDEPYVVMSFPVPPIAQIQAFGDPRTYGIELTYQYR